MATATDNFSSYTAGAALNGPWTQVFATSGVTVIKGISGGNAVEAAATYSEGYVTRNDISPGAAQFSQIQQVELYQGAAYGRVGVRMSGGNTTLNGYVFEWRVSTANSYQICKMTNGVLTTLGATISGSAPAQNDIFRIEISGTTITAYRNGSSIATRTDSSYSSGDVGFGHKNEDAATYGQLAAWSGGDLIIDSPADPITACFPIGYYE